MAHHQGMSLLSLAYVLLDRPMQKCFEADPAFQATTLLLQERIPKAVAPYVHTAELAQSRTAASGPETPMRVFDTPHTAAPEVQLLSNGRYHVMVTNAGGGYSRWNDLAVTRWREDSTRDHWGTFCYLRDAASGKFWSTAYQPTLKRSRQLRGDLLAISGRVPLPRRTTSTRTLRSRFRPRMTSSCVGSRSPTARRRRRTIESDQLRRGRLGLACRGRSTSGFQQPVRANRDPA